MPAVNYLTVVASTVLIFLLGGLWYSPLLFAKPWMALHGKTAEEIKAAGGASPMMYVQVFLCGFFTSWVMALLMARFDSHYVMSGLKLGALCWLGFAAATSYATALFSFTPKRLWLIDTGFNFVSFMIAGVLLAVWP